MPPRAERDWDLYPALRGANRGLHPDGTLPPGLAPGESELVNRLHGAGGG